MKPWTLYALIVGFITWRTSLLISYWLIPGRSFEGSIWILIGVLLWILPIVFGDFFFFFMRKVVANSIGENDHCFLNHLYTIREQKKKKKSVKVSFNSLGWVLWWLLWSSRIIYSFLEKDILVWYFSKKFQSKMLRVEELRRKGVYISKGLKKWICSKIGTSWGSLEIPTIF